MHDYTRSESLSRRFFASLFSQTAKVLELAIINPIFLSIFIFAGIFVDFFCCSAARSYNSSQNLHS